MEITPNRFLLQLHFHGAGGYRAFVASEDAQGNGLTLDG
jgi:hypothetical protein